MPRRNGGVLVVIGGRPSSTEECTSSLFPYLKWAGGMCAALCTRFRFHLCATPTTTLIHVVDSARYVPYSPKRVRLGRWPLLSGNWMNTSRRTCDLSPTAFRHAGAFPSSS